MCDFISWIEKDDEVLFLTRKDIYSARGRELFKDCRDTDVLGHGAIRRFYGVETDGELTPLRGGIACECKDFWNKENYPEKIQKALGDFEGNFSHIWQFMNNYDLCYIIRFGTEKYKRLAWEILLPKASNNDLVYIIEFGPEEYKRLAWEILLPKANNGDLCYIIQYGTEEYKQLACEFLLPKADNYDLYYIIEYGSEEYKQLACEQLLPKADNDDLCYIIEYGTEEYQALAWDLLLPKASNNDLVYIIRFGTEEYKKLAQAELDKLKY